MNRLWKVRTLHRDARADINGLTCYDPAEIYMHPDLDKPLLKHKFIHECLHVVEGAIGMKMSHKQLDAAAGVIHQMLDTAEGEYDGEER